MIGFGLAEKDRGRIYDSPAFVGPQGYLHRYHKTRDTPGGSVVCSAQGKIVARANREGREEML